MATDPAPDSKPRSRARIWLLAAGVVAIPVGLLAVLYQNGTLQRWAARDATNDAALNDLRATPPAVPPPAAASAGWPQFMGPLRDGRAPAGPFRTDWDKNPPKRVWSVPTGGGYSSLAVVGGRLYTQDRNGSDERVRCLDAATGAPVWEYAYPADYANLSYAAGPRATPTVEGNRVYVVGATGAFLCLESPAAAGQPPRVVWRHDLPAEFRAKLPAWGYAGSPLIEADTVIVQPGGKDGSVAAFDKATGAVRWKAGSNPPGYSSPVAATAQGTRVVFAFTGDALLCVHAGTGEMIGSLAWAAQSEGNIATPLVLDDYVFVSSAYGMGCALLRVKPDGGRLKLETVYSRRNKPLRTHHSTAVAVGEYLYGFDTEQGRLTCFNYVRGAEVEEWEAVGVKKGSLILAGKHLVILTQNGDLILAEANPAEYRPVATVRTGFTGSDNWALPVLLDGRLYLRGTDTIICYDVTP